MRLRVLVADNCPENIENLAVPTDDMNGDVPINSFKENFKGVISFIGVDKETGKMDIRFQLQAPAVNFDLSHAGRGKSHGWFFFSCYNSEQANSLLEVNVQAISLSIWLSTFPCIP